jgi:hypothetical protein
MTFFIKDELFEISCYCKSDNEIILNNEELEKFIDKLKNTLDFINEVYENCFDAKTDSYHEYIIKSIAKYENAHDEFVIYEKSKYYVFDTGGYFFKTKEGNVRNWVYSSEIEESYNTLKKAIETLE